MNCHEALYGIFLNRFCIFQDEFSDNSPGSDSPVTSQPGAVNSTGDKPQEPTAIPLPPPDESTTLKGQDTKNYGAES